MTDQLQLPDSLQSLAEVIGKLPPGDIPAAWYVSTDSEVLLAYEKWRQDYQGWRDRLTELMELSGISTERIRYGGFSGQYLIGVYAEGEPPLWWRRDKKGYLVPRKRTKAERESEVSVRFKKVQRIPAVVDYLPGMPTALYMPGAGGTQHVYSPGVRKPAEAVLVFVGADPDLAAEPFVPDERWQRMKMSVYHLLQERQAADGDQARHHLSV